MKITRKQALAQLANAQAQLAATEHESRKVRAARLKEMEKTIAAKELTIENMEKAMDGLNAIIEQQKLTISQFDEKLHAATA